MHNKNNGWISSLHDFSYFKYGTHALLLEWPVARDTETLYKILKLEKLISEQHIIGVIEIVPCYHSIMIYYNSSKTNASNLIQEIEAINITTTDLNISNDIVQIKVSYDEVHAQDLATVADILGISQKDVIDFHSRPIYDVHFIGFLPGFLYLGGLDERLNIPRRATPRVRVPAGSVAIAAGQTGIYPIDSPGGWHIIGWTDKIFFNPGLNPPCQILPGMRVKFEPI